jgi:hypothetical protein
MPSIRVYEKRKFMELDKLTWIKEFYFYKNQRNSLHFVWINLHSFQKSNAFGSKTNEYSHGQKFRS